MKLTRCAVVACVALMMGIAAPTEAQVEMPSDDEIATKLIEHLDLSRAEMSEVAAHVEAGEPDAAMKLWRDLAVDRLRQHDFGQFGWHEYKGHPRPVSEAKYYAGTATEDELREYHPDLVGTDGTTARIRKGNFEYPFPSFVYLYWDTGDALYVRRALELMADFCATSQPEFWKAYRERLAAGEPPADPDLEEWRLNVNALMTGWRYKNVMQVLAGFAKCIGPDVAESWDEVLAPRAAPVSDERLALIPPEQLALIAISGYDHHAGRLLWFCLNPGAVPNQRATGLKALTMLHVIFPNFKDAPQLRELVHRAWTEMLESNFLPDGGSLEQSFNYNKADMEGLEEIVAFYGDEDPPDFVQAMLARASARRAVNEGLRTPLGGLPQVGNSHVVPGKAVWESEEAAQRYLESESIHGREPVRPQDYLSISYPYSGFYAMRDGWGMKALYLFFMNGRPQAGHSMRDNLSIQMTAYGRQMLVCGGPPTYGQEHNDDARGARQYLSEASSLKCNTVMVDGKSQAKDARKAAVAPETPVESRWHTGEHFDYVDGRYSLGYEAPDPDNRDLDMSVEHERSVIFVRDAGLWVIVDRMSAADDTPHTYSQVWNFLPQIDDRDWAKNIAGFREDEFMLDEAARKFRTADPTGPNVAFHHFGPSQVEYRKYYGDRDPWLGWYAPGIGDAVPAVDMHVKWRSADGSVLVTVLAPSDVGDTGPLASVEALDDPDAGVAGFTADLGDGRALAVRCAESPRRLRAGEFAADARLLLVTTSKDGDAGIVRGGGSVDLPGGRSLTSAADCFEFSSGETNGGEVTPIRVPRVPEIGPEPKPVLKMAEHPPVRISGGIDGAEIHYTLDGSEPGADSPVYREPITLTDETTVKARYVVDGEPLRLVATEHYRPWRYSLREPDLTDGETLEPGLHYAWAKRDRWSRLYDLTKDAQFSPIEVGECASIPHIPEDKLQRGQGAMVYTGYLKIPADGVYTFHLTSADGGDLFLYNPERDLEIPPVVRCSYRDGYDRGIAALREGYHMLKIAHKKTHPGDPLVIEVEGPGMERQPLPEEWFFRRRDG